METGTVLFIVFTTIITFLVVIIVLGLTLKKKKHKKSSKPEQGHKLFPVVFAEKVPTVQKEKPVVVYFHLCMIGKWKNILTHLLDRLRSSGLSKKASKVRSYPMFGMGDLKKYLK